MSRRPSTFELDGTEVRLRVRGARLRLRVGLSDAPTLVADPARATVFGSHEAARAVRPAYRARLRKALRRADLELKVSTPRNP